MKDVPVEVDLASLWRRLGVSVAEGTVVFPSGCISSCRARSDYLHLFPLTASNAGELDKKTTITVSQVIAVQDTVLPAGHYVLRLLNPSTYRDVVEILNGDETRLDHYPACHSSLSTASKLPLAYQRTVLAG